MLIAIENEAPPIAEGKGKGKGKDKINVSKKNSRRIKIVCDGWDKDPQDRILRSTVTLVDVKPICPTCKGGYLPKGHRGRCVGFRIPVREQPPPSAAKKRKDCKECPAAALRGNYGFCADHRIPGSGCKRVQKGSPKGKNKPNPKAGGKSGCKGNGKGKGKGGYLPKGHRARHNGVRIPVKSEKKTKTKTKPKAGGKGKGKGKGNADFLSQEMIVVLKRQSNPSQEFYDVVVDWLARAALKNTELRRENALLKEKLAAIFC